MVPLKRSAGILLPVFSLPSPWGVGTLGEAARDFVRFLEAAGQSYWQVLPLGETSFGDSPYQAFSSYAGNPYLIDLDLLRADGLLTAEDYQSLPWGEDPRRVDYALLYRQRRAVLRKAAERLLSAPPADYAAFCRENAFWLEDYALFTALKAQRSGAPWWDWEDALRLRRPAALDAARKELSPELSLHRATQYLFFRQWNALRDFAHAHGVSLIGDLPIYTASDSADVWSAPREFQLDETGHPTEVAGCPPDGFSPDGQLWGNYLFAWDRMAEDGYAWWRRRVLFQLRLYDILRIDHFRGFDAYYAIPAGDDTARNGRWRPGPGLALFQALTAAYGGEMPIIAEDLGFLSDSVRTLVRETGYPGMKVLELAFDSRDSGASDYLPHRVGEHCVVYTGTHDNDTILGWAATAPAADVAFARDYLKLGGRQDWNWAMMDAAWQSPAELAVMQVQDLLGLGHEARMNTPSTLGENWLWRLLPGELTEDLARTVRERMAHFGRL